MDKTASKLDWLKGRADYTKNPVARAATRLLEDRYAPHGDDLYPWILREVKRGNIKLPRAYDNGWLHLVESEMAAEQEIARRHALREPEGYRGDPDSWADDDRAIDWDDIENAPWNRLTDFVDWAQTPQSNEGSGWTMLHNALPDYALQINHPGGPGYREYRQPLASEDLKTWDQVLKHRAKQRNAVDPMQFNAADLATQMNNEWIPEHEDQVRGNAGEVVHQFPDKWTIRRLRDAQEAEQEGEDMGHCVGGYGDWIEQGKTHIFSLRDQRNRPHTTIEITPRSASAPEYDIWKQHGMEPHRGWVETVNWLADGGLEDPDTHERMQQLRPDSPMKKLCDIAQATRERRQQQHTEPWHRGELAQVYGKEDNAPKAEYQNRIRRWFGAMPESQHPTNLSETPYHPNQLDEPWDYETEPPPEWQQPEAPAVPQEPDPAHQANVHYPGLAHKSRSHGGVCHCPWNEKKRPWSFSEHNASRVAVGLGDERVSPEQRDVDRERHDPVGHPKQRQAAITGQRVERVDTGMDWSQRVSQRATDGFRGLLAVENVALAQRDVAEAGWTELDDLARPGGVARLSSAERPIPPEVGERLAAVEEHHELIHSRHILAWEDAEPNMEDWEEPEFLPWRRDSDGKGLINQDGQLLTWQTNEWGDPHHDTVAAEQQFPYVAKVAIRPNGNTFIPSPDSMHLFGIDRESAEALLARACPRQGLRFAPGYTSAAHERTCPTCGDPLTGQYGTFCPRCSWSETDANIDSDPLSNPPDPTQDLHRGIQARMATNRSLYHGTLIDHLPSIQQTGLVPQVGGFTSDSYGFADGAYDYGGDEPMSLEELGVTPAVYMADKRELGKAATAMKAAIAQKLNKDYHEVTPADVAQHGLLVKLKGGEPGWGANDTGLGYAEGDDDYGERPYTVEPGDWWTEDPVGPQGFEYITGPKINQILNRPARTPRPQGWDPQQGQLFTTQPHYDPFVAEQRLGAKKTSDKLHDFLMNPKSRPDLQTPEGQRWLKMLDHMHERVGEKLDPLTPWLTREWKKGRILHSEDGTVGHPWYRWTPPEDHPDGPFEPGVFQRQALSHHQLGHWADFLRSNHPIRRQMGDIMKHEVQPFHDQVKAWDEAMEQAAQQKALEGGTVVHTTPDNWTVRQLTTPEELKAEGDAMGHCVGGYGNQVQSGDSLIYSLRDPNNSPHVTAEIRPERRDVDLPGYVGEYFDGDWEKAADYWGVPVQRMQELAAGAPVAPPEENRHHYEQPMMSGLQDSSFARPIPHGGQIVQIQGRANREPKDEYKARLADWFRTFSPEDRPRTDDEEVDPIYDGSGYAHYELDHPDVIPEYEERNGGLIDRTEPTENEYGLLRHPGKMPSNYNELLDNIAHRDWGYHNVPDPDHLKDIWRLAKERGEVPQLQEALQPYEEKQLEDFEEWLDQNYDYAPRYSEPDDPHGWEDELGQEAEEGEGRPYWQPEGGQGERVYDPDEAERAYERSYGEWQEQHSGMLAANDLWRRANEWSKAQQAPQSPPVPPQTFSAVIPSHRVGKWLTAVEDTP